MSEGQSRYDSSDPVKKFRDSGFSLEWHRMGLNRGMTWSDFRWGKKSVILYMENKPPGVGAQLVAYCSNVRGR